MSAAGGGIGGAATPVVVVASWYPSVIDPAAGRFVADQVVALGRTGRVAPRVISFDPIPLVGGATPRARQAPIVHSAVGSAIAASDPLFVPGFGVDPPVGVARVGVADGAIPALGSTAGEDHRRAVLRPLADRLAAQGDEAPVLVHAHTGYPDGAAAAVLADALGCPLVITEHATFLERILGEPGQRARYAAAIGRASRVIAVSEMLAAQIRAALPEVGSRLVVIPNAVAVDDFTPSPLSDRRPDELLFVGYRKEIKGIDTLLEAFALVLARRPSARLRLVGGNADAALEARWHETARRLGIEDAVAFEAGAARPEVAAAMARASVFVHASRYETFGVVAAEALAAGTPVVATASGGISEILGDDASGLGAVVPVGDATAFAAAVLDVLERRASFDPRRLRAAVERFSPVVVAAQIADLYDAVRAEANDELATPQQSPAADGTANRQRNVPTVPGMWARPTLVMGLDREATAALLAKLPVAFRESLAVLTSNRPGDVALPRTGHLVEVRVPQPQVAASADPPAASGVASRVGRFVAHPLATLEDRRDREAFLEPGIARAVDAVRRALHEAGFTTSGPAPRFVALDGRDVEVATRLAAADGGTLSLGGIRRLADEWAADRAVDGEPGPARGRPQG
ncbi:MAG: glycosyltransferase [Chloroflexota bacterium]